MTEYLPGPAGLYVPAEWEIPVENHDGAFLPDNWRVHTLPVARVDAELVEDAGAGDVDESRIWGRTRAGDNTPDPAALDAAVRRARQAVALQEDAALRQAKSPEDLAADLDQQRRHRNADRSYADRVYQDHLGELDKQRQHAKAMTEKTRRHEAAVTEARFARERILDPTNTLVLLNWALRIVPWLALVPAAFAVAAGCVNVYTELGRINPATWLVNWAVEPLFTWPLVVILIAQILGAVPKPDLSAGVRALRSNQYVVLEVILAGVAIALNVGLHFVPTGSPAGAAVWLVVPVGLAFSAYLVPKLIVDIRRAITQWSAEGVEGLLPVGDEPAGTKAVNPRFSTVGDLRGTNPEKIAENPREEPSDEGREEPGTNLVPEPAQRSKNEARALFFDLVRAGEIDPVNDSVNAVAKRLRTRWANAHEFLDEYRSRN